MQILTSSKGMLGSFYTTATFRPNHHLTPLSHTLLINRASAAVGVTIATQFKIYTYVCIGIHSSEILQK